MDFTLEKRGVARERKQQSDVTETDAVSFWPMAMTQRTREQFAGSALQ